jgi:hypothetical protein
MAFIPPVQLEIEFNDGHQERALHMDDIFSMYRKHRNFQELLTGLKKILQPQIEKEFLFTKDDDTVIGRLQRHLDYFSEHVAQTACTHNVDLDWQVMVRPDYYSEIAFRDKRTYATGYIYIRL